MRRPATGIARRSRRLVVAAVLAPLVASLAAGCVVLTGAGGGQPQTLIGDYLVRPQICASGSGPACDLGNTGAIASPGIGQLLVGLRVPVDVVPAATATSSGPEALAFSQSPSYAAELERLAPAPPGSRWVGYISAVGNYSSTSGPQSLDLRIFSQLRQGADGSPFASRVNTQLRVGGREVTPTAPGTRPVACGPSLTAVFDDDPAATTQARVICVDSDLGFTALLQDLGILAAGARASSQPGTLAILPYTLRYSGIAFPGIDFTLTATSALAGATLAVTPGSLAPASDSDAQALVAVGIPAGARAGTYDVALTARLANGQARTGIGRLTVIGGAAGGGVGGSGPAARLRLTTVLPKRLSARVARSRGIAVLIGASKPGRARVQLFQGLGKKPKVSKDVRLRVPGPVRVILKSAQLKAGAYRIVIAADGRRFVRRATLAR